MCGAPVPRGARACPQCGADERSGWDEEATRHDGLDLPAEAWDEEETGHRGGPGRGPLTGKSLLWAGVSLLVAAAFVYLVLRGAF